MTVPPSTPGTAGGKLCDNLRASSLFFLVFEPAARGVALQFMGFLPFLGPSPAEGGVILSGISFPTALYHCTLRSLRTHVLSGQIVLHSCEKVSAQYFPDVMPQLRGVLV